MTRDERAARAQLAVHSGVPVELAAELFGFSSFYDLRSAEVDLGLKAASRRVLGLPVPRVGEPS